MIPVIGLGNPGDKYENTRHNVGWLVLDALADGSKWKNDKYLFSDTCAVVIEKQKTILIKPQTFMNDSGKVVDGLKNTKPESLLSMIVVHDDIDLPLGVVKISYDRGDGGHNGIKSITKHYGGKDYVRVRIGISKLGESGEQYKPNVLGDFDAQDKKILKDVLKKSVDAIHKIIKLGHSVAMNEVNKK